MVSIRDRQTVGRLSDAEGPPTKRCCLHGIRNLDHFHHHNERSLSEKVSAIGRAVIRETLGNHCERMTNLGIARLTRRLFHLKCLRQHSASYVRRWHNIYPIHAMLCFCSSPAPTKPYPDNLPGNLLIYFIFRYHQLRSGRSRCAVQRWQPYKTTIPQFNHSVWLS